MNDREELTALLMAGAGDCLGKGGTLNCSKLADYLLEHGVIVMPAKGCEYCEGRAYTKKPLTVITRYGRRIELAFEFCPKCGRPLKALVETELKERER